MHAEDGSVDDGVLEVEAGQVVSDTDTVGDRKVPVLPVAFTVVQDDTLAEVVRGLRTSRDVSSLLASAREEHARIG